MKRQSSDEPEFAVRLLAAYFYAIGGIGLTLLIVSGAMGAASMGARAYLASLPVAGMVLAPTIYAALIVLGRLIWLRRPAGFALGATVLALRGIESVASRDLFGLVLSLTGLLLLLAMSVRWILR